MNSDAIKPALTLPAALAEHDGAGLEERLTIAHETASFRDYSCG